MTYNWPDRFKLILVNILINLIVGVMIALFIMGQHISKQYFTALRQIFLTGIILSTFLTLPFFLKEWKKLRRQEEIDETPDLQDSRNIKPFQMWFILIGIVLLVTGYTVSQLYSSFAGALCFFGVLILAGAERYVIRKREKKAQQSAADDLR